ncbi:MAG: hypothetical protein EXR99_07410 [Gemmataceae bacterium]|nr:hypothetical protein [Gemmataceae bacterium]
MNEQLQSRRNFLSLASGYALSAVFPAWAQGEKSGFPVRAITKGPGFHWFGYYDKLQFDPSSRFALGMRVSIEHRSPKPEDAIQIGMVDLQDKDNWINLGTSKAWCWQQGCMLQWLPGSAKEILWNDRQEGEFVCHVLDVKTGKKRTLPHPIYAVSPDGKTAIAADFRRLHDTRPGYGYAGVPDPSLELAPKDSGIFSVDLQTGTQKLLFSMAQLAAFGELSPSMKGAKHWFNHLLFNTDGSRFVFLHRWKPAEGKVSFKTRMVTARADGSDLFVLDPSGETSHFIWRDPNHILAWTKPEGKGAGFYLFKDKTAEVLQVGAGIMTKNGHCSYIPGNDWILNDTYPDRERLQHPYLFHLPTGKNLPLGRFLSPKEYAGEWRCDTHPRFSPDGNLVCIDSPHEGKGRQLYLIDISGRKA